MIDVEGEKAKWVYVDRLEEAKDGCLDLERGTR